MTSEVGWHIKSANEFGKLHAEKFHTAMAYSESHPWIGVKFSNTKISGLDTETPEYRIQIFYLSGEKELTTKGTTNVFTHNENIRVPPFIEYCNGKVTITGKMPKLNKKDQATVQLHIDRALKSFEGLSYETTTKRARGFEQLNPRDKPKTR